MTQNRTQLAGFLLFACAALHSIAHAFPSTGPDLITGDLPAVQQFGRSGDEVGLAVGTISCNAGDAPVTFTQTPSTNHPVAAINLYRLTPTRIEQIGQSWVMHTFAPLQNNTCGFGCAGGCGADRLCPGCASPHTTTTAAAQNNLSSRAWVQPFAGVLSASAFSHAGHSHNGASHRMAVVDADLTQDDPGNAAAQYLVEAQHIAPEDSAAGNQFNNVSHRLYSVTGNSGETYAFAPIGPAVAMSPALDGWSGATQALIEPAPGVDGRAWIAFLVTGPVEGIWHYEYAVYNMNLDRAIESLTVPTGCAAISNVTFHAPRNAPGFPSDGTAGSAGYSNDAWQFVAGSSSASWATEPVAVNPNANAIRWGTLYNFAFDADRPPTAVAATIGLFKTGDTFAVAVAGPGHAGDLNADGLVNALDGDVLVNVLLGFDPDPSHMQCADVNGDGANNGADIGAWVAVALL